MDRAKEKQEQRNCDLAKLVTGGVTAEDLAKRNDFFANLGVESFQLVAIGNRPLGEKHMNEASESTLHTAYAQHFATGEGMTYMVLVGYGTPTDLRLDFEEAFGDYYATGVEIHDGLKWDLDGMNLLVSLEVRAELERLQGTAMISYQAKFHINLS